MSGDGRMVMVRFGIRRLFLAMAFFAALGLACGFDRQEKKVYDDGELLTEDEEVGLQELLVETADRTEQDLIIVTIRDNGGKESGDFADDFYDRHGFGYEKKNGSGVLFLIDMDARTFYIRTAGTAIERYTDAEISDTLDALMPDMRAGDYAGACFTFISEAERYLTGGETAENGYYDIEEGRFVEYPAAPKEPGWKKAVSPKRLAVVFSVSAAVSAFAVLIISRSRKTRKNVNGGTYMKDGGLQFRERSDRFTHTTVVTRKLPKDNGGSAGHTGRSYSSSHTSSGGRSHGGGGRSF